jgi:trk system potassium uptake protein TrkH
MEGRFRFRVALLITARFGPALILLLLPPLLVALFGGERGVALVLAASTLPCVAASFAIRRRPPPSNSSAAESVGAVTLTFAFAGILLAPVYLVSGLDLTDAVFEGISGITSTGLSRYTTPENLSFPVLFTRSWSQWVGGYAIIALVAAVLSPALKASKDIGAMNVEADDRDMRKASLITLVAYAVLTVLVVLGLLVTGTDVKNAFLYGLAATPTGGFAPHSDSAGLLSRPSIVVLSVFFTLSALALTDLTMADGKKRERVGKLGAVLLAILALTTISAASLRLFDGLGWFDSAFTALSAQTTTGFNTAPIDELSTASKSILLMNMFVGGDVGSSGGGVKILRFLMLGALVLHIAKGAREKFWPDDSVRITLCVLVGYALVIALGCVLISLLGTPFLDSLFEITSAVGTVGLSAGVTLEPPNAATIWVLTAGMLLGRTEVLLLALVLAAASRKAG